MRGRRHILTPLLLLTLFLTYQAGITMFTHVHIMNGGIIVHSHPASDSHHAHTPEQIVSIAQLTNIQTLEAETQEFVPAPLSVLYVIDYQIDVYQVDAPHLRCVRLRAPPYCC